MVAPNDIRAEEVIDRDSVDALREILDDPAIPVATTAVGPGARIGAVREAVDHLTTVGALAVAAHSVAAGERLLSTLADIDAGLADTVRWHIALSGVLAGLEPGRARNTLLGNIGRGDVLTWAHTVRGWSWSEGAPPRGDATIGHADGELEIDHYPGLYDYLLVWEPTGGSLVAVPTYRDRISWEQTVPASGRPATWVVRLARTTFHVDDLIPLDRHPRELTSWREPIHPAPTSEGAH
ncbi:hypothetical protein [Nocardia aurea]|uniref:hypothetical protein n=1 Tax=Nocardia aurea TaxID=2144174 RepID=UPI0033AA2F57